MCNKKSLEAGDELLRFGLLIGSAFAGDFLEDVLGAVLVADLEVGLGELELRARAFAAATTATATGVTEVEAEPTEVRRRGSRRSRGLGRRAHVQAAEVEVERGFLFLGRFQRNVEARHRS